MNKLDIGDEATVCTSFLMLNNFTVITKNEMSGRKNETAAKF